ncbi:MULTISPECIES: hypothetical protein [Bacillus cereus group]|uniref:Uncharacterized protein n=1 Tax=Bacillus cereus 03BB108 TaxID=451709 RepID=A0AAN0SSB6_BACCE|nr:hypothetical protein [Bacillus cereus]AJI08798.1 hypothetical protein AK40_5781 [Bacillus cereus 03BB108]EDX60073.1 coiled-coil domain-containing protein 64A, putative [Bacillus cereus 03BB108]QKG99246.1 hypothetical protein FOC96_03015 [Bacillus cereus]HDR7255028.1 hypothetical protein [Bacillus pacificus]
MSNLLPQQKENNVVVYERAIYLKQELNNLEPNLRQLMDDFSNAAELKNRLRKEQIQFDLKSFSTKLDSIASEIKELESIKRDYKAELYEIIMGDAEDPKIIVKRLMEFEELDVSRLSNLLNIDEEKLHIFLKNTAASDGLIMQKIKEYLSLYQDTSTSTHLH